MTGTTARQATQRRGTAGKSAGPEAGSWKGPWITQLDGRRRRRRSQLLKSEMKTGSWPSPFCGSEEHPAHGSAVSSWTPAARWSAKSLETPPLTQDRKCEHTCNSKGVESGRKTNQPQGIASPGRETGALCLVSGGGTGRSRHGERAWDSSEGHTRNHHMTRPLHFQVRTQKDGRQGLPGNGAHLGSRQQHLQ